MLLVQNWIILEHPLNVNSIVLLMIGTDEIHSGHEICNILLASGDILLETKIFLISAGKKGHGLILL